MTFGAPPLSAAGLQYKSFLPHVKFEGGKPAILHQEGVGPMYDVTVRMDGAELGSSRALLSSVR